MLHEETLRIGNRVGTIDEIERELYISNKQNDLVDVLYQLGSQLEDAQLEIDNLTDFNPHDFNDYVDEVEDELISLKTELKLLISKVEDEPPLTTQEMVELLNNFLNELTDAQHTLCTYR